MARVTVEDCIDKVDNRFDLVLLAAHRARALSGGAPLTLDRDDDKHPVIALREIAEETIAPEDVREGLIHSLQKYVEVDEPEPEPVIAQAGETAENDGAVDDVEPMSERISEEDLLKGLEDLLASENESGGGY